MWVIRFKLDSVNHWSHWLSIYACKNSQRWTATKIKRSERGRGRSQTNSLQLFTYTNMRRYLSNHFSQSFTGKNTYSQYVVTHACAWASRRRRTIRPIDIRRHQRRFRRLDQYATCKDVSHNPNLTKCER